MLKNASKLDSIYKDLLSQSPVYPLLGWVQIR